MIKKMEKGQSIVLVTFLLFAFFFILALVLDGGFLYYMRRNAQNAADAGALAGADDLCKYQIAFQAKTVAETFADNNLETVVSTSLATVTPMNNPDGNFAGGIVTVETTIDYQTFFARLIGVETVYPPGYAKAGCAPVTDGIGVMPVVFSCRPPNADPDGPFTDEDCYLKFGDPPHCSMYDEGDGDIDPMYIVVETDSTEDVVYCKDPETGEPPGGINCDLDDDGENDISQLITGNKGFISMDGGPSGTDQIRDWIEFGYDERVPFHIWFPGKPGGKTEAVGHFDTRLHDTILIPIFDTWCEDDPRETNCDGKITLHPGGGVPYQDTYVDAQNTKFDFFHIFSFGGFHVECVDAQGQGGCPVNEFFGYGENNKIKTVEGCFFEEYLPGAGGLPGVGEYMGMYTVFLME